MDQMGTALHLRRPTFILAEIISAYTGGLDASSIVAYPFLAYQLIYLCNRILIFQSTIYKIKTGKRKIISLHLFPHLTPIFEVSFYKFFILSPNFFFVLSILYLTARMEYPSNSAISFNVKP
jgi:hypothetical protein